MVEYRIFYTKKVLKSIPKLKAVKLDDKVKSLMDIIRNDPFQTPPPYKVLQGDLQGAYARRINHKHRLVYEVLEEERVIKIIDLWNDYKF